MIPVSEPSIGKKEIEYVNQALKSGWISSKGKFIDKFEEKFAKYCGVRYAVSTTSGTAALHLALASLNITRDDEVIIPTFTMIATAFTVVYCDATPVLVDAESETFNIDPQKIEEKITKKTKAIMVVHLYGHPCDMNPILQIAKKHKLLVIEDAAEAHGAEYKRKKVGSFGDVGCFSFYGNKIITTGEGGMIVTNNKKLAERAKLLKNMAFGQGVHKFEHLAVGYNYRFTNVQAAIGLAQMERIEKIIYLKRKIARQYNRSLRNIADLTTPVEKEGVKNVYWMYTILVDGGKRDWLIDKLAKKDIETRPFFVPIHQQPVFKKQGLFYKEKYPIAERISKMGLYLPSSPKLTLKEIEFISSTIAKSVKL